MALPENVAELSLPELEREHARLESEIETLVADQGTVHEHILRREREAFKPAPKELHQVIGGEGDPAEAPTQFEIGGVDRG